MRGMRALTCKERVVNLNIPHTGIIQNIQLFPVRYCDILEILLLSRINFLRESLSLSVPQMVPNRRNHRHLNLRRLLRRQQALDVLELVNQGAFPLVADFAGAHARLAGAAFLEEAGDIGDVVAEDGEGWVLDFFETVEFLEERSPEDSAPERWKLV